jgi:hypothetical protein
MENNSLIFANNIKQMIMELDYLEFKKQQMVNEKIPICQTYRENEIDYILTNLVHWYPEFSERLTDAERVIFQAVVERAEKLLR